MFRHNSGFWPRADRVIMHRCAPHSSICGFPRFPTVVPSESVPMPDLLRQEIATAAHTIIVKVGTRVLTGPGGTLNQQRVAALAEELHQVISTNRRVALVTSGAVGAGLGTAWLWPMAAHGIWPNCKRVAAVGQSHLIEASTTGRLRPRSSCGPTSADGGRPGRPHPLSERAQHDPLAVRVWRGADHQRERHGQRRRSCGPRLAITIGWRPWWTNLVQAPLLVLLSDVDGLFDGDPRDPGSRLIPTVTQLDAQIMGLVCVTRQPA